MGREVSLRAVVEVDPSVEEVGSVVELDPSVEVCSVDEVGGAVVEVCSVVEPVFTGSKLKCQLLFLSF